MELQMSKYIFFAATAIILTIVVFLIQPLFISPLRKYPGPFLAKISAIWLIKVCRYEKRSKEVQRLHCKHGDFVRIAPNHVSINCPEAMRELYSHKAKLEKGHYYTAFLQGPLNVFNMRNFEDHSRRKRVLAPAFSEGNLNLFEPELDKVLHTWKGQLTKMAAGRQPCKINMALWITLLAFDSIGAFAFGSPFGFCEKGEDDLNLGATIAQRASVFNTLGVVPAWLRPWMAYLPFDHYFRSLGAAKVKLGAFAVQALERRRTALGGDEKRQDLTSFLLRSTDPDTGEPIPDAVILSESTGFIAAGSHSTAVTMTFFLDIISREHTLRRRIQAELDQAFPEPLPEHWTASRQTAAELPLLMATIRESQRYQPTSVAGLERVVPPGGRVICGEYFPAGTSVSSPTLGALHDARVFENPDEFRPERWMQPAGKELLTHFYPFSLGPRVCLGRPFAMFEMVKTLATLLRCFEIDSVAGAPIPHKEGFFESADVLDVYLSRRNAGGDL